MRKAIWGGVLLVCGCTGSKLDLGAHDAGMGKPGPTSESCENGPQLPIVGSWTGYIENQKWASGSDVIHMVITNANDTLACGTVSLGDKPPAPPATDPNTDYPPGEFDPAHAPPAWDISTFIDYTEGVVMPAAQGKVTGARLQFQANWASTWDAWCALQTPVADNGDFDVCLQGGGIDNGVCYSAAPASTVVDCGRYMLCALGGFCQCTAQGCQAWHTNCDTLDFDMQIAADLANGSVALGCDGVHNVHFTRDP